MKSKTPGAHLGRAKKKQTAPPRRGTGAGQNSALGGASKEARKAHKPEKPIPKKGKSNPIPNLDALYAAWLEEPIMEDWFELTEALEKIKDSPAEEAMLPTAFLRRVRIDLLTVPHCFPNVTDDWNKFCDRVGWPQEKKNAPGPEEPAPDAPKTDEPF